MKQKLTFCASALTGLCLLSPVAMAQDTGKDNSVVVPAQTAAAITPPDQSSELTIGTQWVGGGNTGQYGRYNGFTQQGFDFLLGFDVHKRDPWNSGTTSYYEASGVNLDIQTGDRLAKGFKDNAYTSDTNNKWGPNAQVNVEFGEQGIWKITAGYGAISYTGNIIDSIYTVTGSNAVLNNGFVPWGGATNSPLKKGATTAFTTATLSPAIQAFQVGTRRDALTIGGQYIVGDWTVASNIQHEHKQGTLEESLRETYGGQAFTMPVDYDTDRFDVSANYIEPDFQAAIEYTYSRFTDNNMAVTLPYPVSISALSATSGPYAQSGLYSTPPGNAAHYLTITMADKLSPKTRITFNGRVGVELQNSVFPANSADPSISSTLGTPTYNWFKNLNAMNQGTSATSPNASAWIYQGNIAVTSSLAPEVDARASYSFDGRSVDINQYKVWIGGSSPDATANTAVYVVPQSWFKQTASLEVGYRIVPESNTKLTFDYSFNNINRTNAQVEHSITNTESLQLSSMLGADMLGRLTYEHSDRNGSLIYGTAWGNLEGGDPETYSTPSGAYYQAPMTSDSITLRGDYAPTGNLSGGLFVKYVDEHFHYPSIPSTAPSGDWTLVGHGEGITQDSNLTVGPDINYRPAEDISLHAYYTYEQIYFDNRGNGACAESNTGTCAGSAGYYQNKYTSSMNSAGLSGDWQVNEKLKLAAEYNMSSGSVIFGQYNGVMVSSVSQSYQNVASYPDINSTMHDVRLTAVYQFTDAIEGSLLYQFSMFHNNDWNDQTPAIQPTTNTGTAISILTPGYAAPNYNVSTIGAVFRVKL